MRMYDIVNKKKLGKELSKEEIGFFIKDYVLGQIPDYQVAALLMAIYFKGMSYKETADLTAAMASSGDQIDLSGILGIKVDKHSTGGVGDKTTLIVAPIVAACGLPVAKMSGRGLGHTGGTIDKLESVIGFRSELTTDQFIKQVNDHKLAIVGQTGNLAPADKKLYALRDVTSTVDSIPLIASSIMSKKIASGADAIILDVKVGNGAFMKSLVEAEELATCMVSIGEALGRKTLAVISDMEQPLGNTVGNSMEVLEAIHTLQGKGPKDLMELSSTLAAHMLILGGLVTSKKDAILLIEKVINNGSALAKFYKFLELQGVAQEGLETIELDLNKTMHVIQIPAWTTGYVEQILAEEIGKATMMLGAGRVTKDSSIDSSVGIRFFKKVGDFIMSGDIFCELHCNNIDSIDLIMSIIKKATVITDSQVMKRKLIYKVIEEK